MVAVNIIMYTMSAMVAAIVITVQVNSAPVNVDAWLLDAQNTIKRNLNDVESCKLDGKLIKSVTNGQFDLFTQIVKVRVSNLIQETNRINSEEMFMLRRKLIKWLEGLVRVNSEPDYNNKTPRKALDKFILTIDFMIYEVFRFIKFNHFESPEVMEIAERLNWLFKELVNELVNSTKSIKIQVDGLSNHKMNFED